jgi:uncharacterized protein YrrD
MTLSASQIYGAKLGSTDGEIGHVKDCYFDDQSWTIRYLVADTGFWLRVAKSSSLPMPWVISLDSAKSFRST